MAGPPLDFVAGIAVAPLAVFVVPRDFVVEVAFEALNL